MGEGIMKMRGPVVVAQVDVIVNEYQNGRVRLSLCNRGVVNARKSFFVIGEKAQFNHLPLGEGTINGQRSSERSARKELVLGKSRGTHQANFVFWLLSMH